MAFLSKVKLSYSWKMRGYPQFSFWIPTALANICFFLLSHKLRKNTFLLIGTGENPIFSDDPEMHRT